MGECPRFKDAKERFAHWLRLSSKTDGNNVARLAEGQRGMRKRLMAFGEHWSGQRDSYFADLSNMHGVRKGCEV